MGWSLALMAVALALVDPAEFDPSPVGTAVVLGGFALWALLAARFSGRE